MSNSKFDFDLDDFDFDFDNFDPKLFEDMISDEFFDDAFFSFYDQVDLDPPSGINFEEWIDDIPRGYADFY